MKYVFVASTDSLDYHPSNVPHDFTVELPDTIIGKYSCVLLDFYCLNITEELYVFCDICEQSYVKDHKLPLMRIITHTGEVTIPYYTPVTRRNIQRMRIYIRNKDLEAPALDIGPVRCTIGLLPLK